MDDDQKLHAELNKIQMQQFSDALKALFSGDEKVSQEAQEEIKKQLPRFDHEAFLNTPHLPKDADIYTRIFEDMLAHIPDGWGRWLSIDKGWYPLVAATHLAIKRIAPDYEIYQVKEKFAGLRYYYGHSSKTEVTEAQDKEIERIINQAEEVSLKICQECGELGELVEGRSQYGWLSTLCPKHQETRDALPLEEKNNWWETEGKEAYLAQARAHQEERFADKRIIVLSRKSELSREPLSRYQIVDDQNQLQDLIDNPPDVIFLDELSELGEVYIALVEEKYRQELIDLARARVIHNDDLTKLNGELQSINASLPYLYQLNPYYKYSIRQQRLGFINCGWQEAHYREQG